MRITTIAVLAALLLAGCTSDKDKGLCPSAAVLASTSVLTVFRSGAPADPSDELYTVWMRNVDTDCDFDKKSKMADSSLRIMFGAKRAPNSEPASYKIPYFVAVTQGGDRIMTKKMFVVQFSFAPGASSASFEDTLPSTVIKLGRENKVGSYMILTGLQLTQAQLDYNKKTGRFAP